MDILLHIVLGRMEQWRGSTEKLRIIFVFLPFFLQHIQLQYACWCEEHVEKKFSNSTCDCIVSNGVPDLPRSASVGEAFADLNFIYPIVLLVLVSNTNLRAIIVLTLSICPSTLGE
jgi:hypothetical protein